MEIERSAQPPFNLNKRKYGPEKLQIGALFMQICMVAEGCHSEKKTNRQTKKNGMCFIKIPYIKELLIN